MALFRDALSTQVSHILDQLSFDFVQLHGSEDPNFARNIIGTTPIIKAISWTGRSAEQELVRAWKAAAGYDSQQQRQIDSQNLVLAGFLVDAYAPQQGGGTGQVANWQCLMPRPFELEGLPLMLAGGLTPANVAEAIAAVKPDGVDTASGVEQSPGTKSSELVRAFANAARTAWQC